MFGLKQIMTGAAIAAVLPMAAHAGVLTTAQGDGYALLSGSTGLDENFGTDTALGYDAAVVDYAVFSPGSGFDDFLSFYSFGATDPTGGSEYIYAYQVDFTSYGGTDSAGQIRTFSVGLDDGDADFVTVWDSEPGIDSGALTGSTGVQPNGTTGDVALNTNSVFWSFNQTDAIDDGETSAILFFSSEFGPETDNADISRYLAPFYFTFENLGKKDGVPSPTPEPATLGLMAVGMLIAIRRRVR